MAVYLNASGRISAKICQNRTACQLGQAVDLPYCNAFDKPLLSLDALCELLIQQAQQCAAKAGWADWQNVPILLGSTAYTIADCEYRFLHQQPLPATPNITQIAERLRQRFGSPVFSFATSCTSSAQAIGYAAKMIEQGKCDKALVLGFEMFNRLTFEHFQAMGLLAQNMHESGIILGEGIGCVALSNQPSDCQILGIASLTDNESLTNSSGEALAKLLAQILAKSGCSKEEVSLIKPHFVGGSFDAEEQAILQIFAQNRPLAPLLKVAKKQLGHTLGASGAMETAWLCEQLQEEKAQICLNYFLGFGGANIGWVLKWK